MMEAESIPLLVRGGSRDEFVPLTCQEISVWEQELGAKESSDKGSISSIWGASDQERDEPADVTSILDGQLVNISHLAEELLMSVRAILEESGDAEIQEIFKINDTTTEASSEDEGDDTDYDSDDTTFGEQTESIPDQEFVSEVNTFIEEQIEVPSQSPKPQECQSGGKEEETTKCTLMKNLEGKLQPETQTEDASNIEERTVSVDAVPPKETLVPDEVNLHKETGGTELQTIGSDGTALKERRSLKKQRLSPNKAHGPNVKIVSSDATDESLVTGKVPDSNDPLVSTEAELSQKSADSGVQIVAQVEESPDLEQKMISPDETVDSDLADTPADQKKKMSTSEEAHVKGEISGSGAVTMSPEETVVSDKVDLPSALASTKYQKSSSDEAHEFKTLEQQICCPDLAEDPIIVQDETEPAKTLAPVDNVPNVQLSNDNREPNLNYKLRITDQLDQIKGIYSQSPNYHQKESGVICQPLFGNMKLPTFQKQFITPYPRQASPPVPYLGGDGHIRIQHQHVYSTLKRSLGFPKIGYMPSSVPSYLQQLGRWGCVPRSNNDFVQKQPIPPTLGKTYSPLSCLPENGSLPWSIVKRRRRMYSLEVDDSPATRGLVCAPRYVGDVGSEGYLCRSNEVSQMGQMYLKLAQQRKKQRHSSYSRYDQPTNKLPSLLSDPSETARCFSPL